MDLQERLLNITQNEEVYGQCTPETAATVINNENLLDKPAPYFMYEPAETNPNGSIAVNETYNMLKSGSYDGAGAVLANARLFSLYNPIRAELFDTEQRYKKLIFDNSGFFNQFSNNFMRNWYGMQQAEAIYKMRRAEEDGDISSMQSYKFQAEELQRKMNKYVIPEDGINNTLANFTASWARNAPTLTAIGIGAGAVTLLTGGTGTAAYLATAGSMLSSALIIKNDSFGIEAGDMLTAIETDEKLSQLPLNEKLKIAEDYANIASWLESFSALFGLLRIGGKAVTRGTISLLGQGATRTGMKGVGKVIEKATLTGIKKTIKKSEKEQIIKELLNKGIAEKLKDPKYFSYLGKKTLEYALAASEETGTEVTQQIIQDAFLKAVEDGESPDNINVIDNIYKILGDESESSKYAQLALNVFIAAGILGGVGAGIGAGVRSGYNKIISRSMNNADINELSQDIINLKKNSDVYSKSRKAYNEATTELVNAGSAPETVTFDAFKVLDILDEAEKNGDSAILTKLKQLGISRDNLEKSVSGTGVLKIDFSQFDDVVLDPDDTSLFQKVKGLYSFDETTLNKLELEAAINNLVEKQPELQQAMNDPESIFNIAMRGLDEKQFTPQQKAYFSVLAQLMTNRIATFEGGDGRKFALDILNRMQSDLVKTPEDLFMFVRPTYSEISVAQQMKSEGKTDKEILKETGLSYDKKYNLWFKEISDKDTVFDYDNLKRVEKGETLRVGDLINHDSLFELLPEVKDIPVVKNNNGDYLMAYYTTSTKSGDIVYRKIAINFRRIKELTQDEIKREFLHEIQHAIQRIYRLEKQSTRGRVSMDSDLYKIREEQEKITEKLYERIKDSIVGEYEPSRFLIQDSRKLLDDIAKKDKNVSEMLKEWDKLDEKLSDWYNKSSYSKYLEAAQENQARDVSYRMDMSDDERRNVLPFGAIGQRTPIVRFKVGNEIVEAIQQDLSQDQIAGVLTPVEAGKYIMRLTEAANPTTFMHEFSHLATLEMIDSFNSGKMTPYWQKEMLKIADFVDAKPVDGKLTFTTAQHEKVSEAFTTYLKEGKAPIESLNDLFARMREWFVDVYKKLRMGNVRLNKSIRSAFDSLLVSQEDMDRAIIDKNLRAIGRRSWVKEDDYQKYLSDLSKLNRISTSKHLEAIRKQQRLATEEKNKSKLNDIRKDVSAQINNDPRYQLVNDVRVRKINKDSIPNGYKVNKASVYTSVEGGIPIEQFITDHIDVVSNAADVVELLNNIEDKDELIERTAQEQFNEWLEREYPELADVNADSAATNLELVKVRVKEYMMLMKIPLSQFNQYYNELVKATNAEIETMKLRELTNIERLLDLETRIVTKARVAKSDSELASALWHQAAVDYIIVRAKEIRKEVNKFSKHFDKYRYLPNETRLKRIDAYDFDMITAILKNIGFTNKSSRVKDIPLSTRLTQWIEDRALREFSDAEEIRDYIPSLTQDRGVKFENNTYHDFGIYDTLVRLIEGISESDYVLTEENKNVLREKDISAVVDYQKKKKINPSLMSWWTDKVVMKEQFLKKIFPNRQFLDYVIPFIQGTTLREQRIGRNYELISDALSDYVKNRNKIFAVPLSNGVLNMTYGDMQVAVLNIDNMEKWVNSWNKQKQDNLTTDDFLSIIEYAPQKMLDNAQKIWNVFESQKEEFRDAQYKINGFLMDYVEPRKITLSNGREIQSGYYPSGKMPTQQTDFNSTIMSFKNNGVYTMATSRYAKDRQENNRHSDLDLSLNSLRSWLYHTATVIEIGPHFNKLSKMINSSSMSNQLGENITKTLNDWMTYSIVGDNINKLYATFDKISSVQVLGWEPFRLIVQALGWIPAMSTIGPQWMIPQFLKASAYGNFIPFKLETAAQLSPYMKERYENAVNHILSVSESNQLIRTGKTLGDKLLNSFMWFTVHGDAFSSYIVWNAAHDKAIALGYSNEDAVSMADSAVRTSQGDSTAVSRPKILQGDKRFITKFASYFVAMNSIISSAIIGRDRAELVAITMLAGVLSPILESYVRSAYDWAVGSDDDKKKWRRLKLYTFEDVLFYNMKQNLYTTIGQTTMPIAGLGGYFGNLVATGSAYDKPLPMIDYMQNLLKIPGYSTLALKADTDSDRKRYLTNLEKSFLKSLTVPNKYIRMFTEGD